MFTGIVEEVGTVASLKRGRLAVQAAKVLEGTKLGDSISVNGACLTVVELKDRSFTVDVMPETLKRTSLGSFGAGDKVNLERALTFGGSVGGHLVQGHVDAAGRVLSVTSQGAARVMSIAAPHEVARYVVEKGFIAVDGVSLTVTRCDAASFDVSLVGYTLQHTILGNKRPGDMVNLEADIMAKYVERLLPGEKRGVTMDTLADHGFLSMGRTQYGAG